MRRLSEDRDLEGLHGVCGQKTVTKTWQPYGWRGRLLNKILYEGGYALRSNPLPFYIPLLTDKIPFSHILY